MRKLFAIALLLVSATSTAQENFVTYPGTLYPPACAASTYFENEEAQGPSEQISQGLVSLIDLADRQTSSVRITLTRHGCSEAGRAVIKVQFEVISGGSAALPIVQAVIDDTPYVLRLTRDPNGFEELNAGSLIFAGGEYVYFLDGPTAPDREFLIDEELDILTVEQYNGEFDLEFIDFIDFRTYAAPIPAYDGSLERETLPLNGRLSGTWINQGTSDQGFLLAFEELPDGSQILFFSWYTFDKDGNMLWLTSSAGYEIGESSVDFDLILVTDGEFQGATPASRQAIGTASLSAIDCNNLQLSFDLSALELGSDTIQLERLFSLETAGFSCRDQAEREATISG